VLYDILSTILAAEVRSVRSAGLIDGT
jgi:hypothetical protein